MSGMSNWGCGDFLVKLPYASTPSLVTVYVDLLLLTRIFRLGKGSGVGILSKSYYA
jgi:hypothetical protein